jgi:hypothetical protein
LKTKRKIRKKKKKESSLRGLLCGYEKRNRK